jgi:hypothetical protein
MIHKSSFIPGLSKFIDESILSHYPATSMKRILMAGGVSLYLKQNEGVVDSLLNNPLIKSLGVVKSDGSVDIEPLRDALKGEIKKAGFMRLSLPVIGDIDFTTEDVDTLYRLIIEADSTQTKPSFNASQTNMNNGGVY